MNAVALEGFFSGSQSRKLVEISSANLSQRGLPFPSPIWYPCDGIKR